MNETVPLRTNVHNQWDIRRPQATGVCSVIARIFGLVIPFISKLSTLWAPLPMVVLGFPPLVLSALILLFLPEVTNMKLPQNTEEAIELHKRSKLKQSEE